MQWKMNGGGLSSDACDSSLDEMAALGVMMMVTR